MTNYKFIKFDKYADDSIVSMVEAEDKESAVRQVLTDVYGYWDEEVDSELLTWTESDDGFGVDHEEYSFLLLTN